MKTTPSQIQALYKVLRQDADASGYGWAISDDKLLQMATEGAEAVVNASPDSGTTGVGQ
jgi:hypothetical protein